MLKNLIKDLENLANPEKAKILSGFFKTGVGQYGEGDKFYGITVPEQRKLVKKYLSLLDLNDIEILLNNPYHEQRLVGVLLLVEKFKKASIQNQREIFEFYIKSSQKINNWDLVDLSAPNIVGNYLINKDKTLLYEFAISTNLWQKRIAIISTFEFIKSGFYDDTFKICEILMFDKHDLIHKACGWMLREVGKRISEKVLCDFLDKNINLMPRTMLRYAIERFEESKRKEYLSRK